MCVYVYIEFDMIHIARASVDKLLFLYLVLHSSLSTYSRLFDGQGRWPWYTFNTFALSLYTYSCMFIEYVCQTPLRGGVGVEVLRPSGNDSLLIIV